MKSVLEKHSRQGQMLKLNEIAVTQMRTLLSANNVKRLK
jgi:hypothetical protein